MLLTTIYTQRLLFKLLKLAKIRFLARLINHQLGDIKDYHVSQVSNPILFRHKLFLSLGIDGFGLT